MVGRYFGPKLGGCTKLPWLTSDRPSASVWATRAMRFARLVLVDFASRHWLPERPFPAAQSSRNWPVRLGWRFAVDTLPALLAEGDDATQSRWQRGVPLFPSEQIQPNLRKPEHPGP